MFERDYFSSPVRAQLTTTSFKPCTYFAKRNGTSVFVKGPYPTAEAAGLQERVHELKKMLVPGLPIIQCNVVELLVDVDFLDCQFGARKLWKKPTGFFLICNDLLQVEGPLPTKTVSSKVWSRPTLVVDFDQQITMRHSWYDPCYEKSMFALLPVHCMRQWVLHVLLSWVCGCGADLARRNFFVFNQNMYQVDLEAWAKFEWNISDTVVGSFSRKAGEQMIGFVTKEWNELSPVLHVASMNLEMSGQTFFEDHGLVSASNQLELEIMKDRIGSLQTLDGVVQVLNLRREPRAKKSKTK